MYFIIWTILELYIFSWCADRWGFLDTIFIYMLPSVAGVLLISILNRKALFAIQKLQDLNGNFQGAQVKWLHVGIQFLGSIFLIIPSALTRMLGIFLVLPGIRHLIIWFAKGWLFLKLANTFSKSGNIFFRFGTGGFENRGTDYSSRFSRDVTPEKLEQFEGRQGDSGKGGNVIDVESKRIE